MLWKECDILPTKDIASYLQDLINQRNQLAANLNTMGVDASDTELLNTLVPKVLQIIGSSEVIETGYGVSGTPVGLGSGEVFTNAGSFRGGEVYSNIGEFINCYSEIGYTTDSLLFLFDGISRSSIGSTSEWENLKSGQSYSFTTREDWLANGFYFYGDNFINTNVETNYNTITAEAIVSLSTIKTSEVDIVDNFQDGGFGLVVNNGVPNFTVMINGTWYNIASSETLEVNKLYYIAGTYDGSTACLYINGVLVSSTEVAGIITYPDTNTNLEIGRNANASTSSYYFQGKIFAVRIYSKALSLSEITANYAIDYSRYLRDITKTNYTIGSITNLTHWFDFTNSNNNECLYSMQNPCYTEKDRNIWIFNGEQNDDSLRLSCTSTSYAKVDIGNITTDNFTLYAVYKTSRVLSNDAALLGMSYRNNDGQLLRLNSNAGYIQLYSGSRSNYKLTTDVLDCLWNVVAIVSDPDSNGVKLYVNGHLKGTLSNFNIGSVLALGHDCGINFNVVQSTYYYPVNYRLIAVADTCHTEDQIITNTGYIKTNYITNYQNEEDNGRTYLIKEGEIQNDFPFYQIVNREGYGGVSAADDNRCMQLTSGNITYAMSGLNTQNGIDLTDYNKLCFRAFGSSIGSYNDWMGYSSAANGLAYGGSNQYPLSYRNKIASIKPSTSQTIYEMDISDITDSYYVGFFTDRNSTIYLSDIWLE